MAAETGLSRRFSNRWNRLNGPSRIPGVDLARGLAVLGMLAAHLLWIGDVDPTAPSTWVGIVNGRSSILFATLAGVSIGLVTGGPAPLAGTPLRTARIRLAVRAGLLWVIGALLIATGVPVYVILPAYAILFLLALPLVTLGARTLLILAGVLAIVMPFVQVALDALPLWSTIDGANIAAAIGWHYPFPVWLAFVVAGLALARLGIRDRRVQVGALLAGSVLASLGYGLDLVSGADAASEPLSFWGQVWTARPHSSGVLEVIGSGGFAVAVIGACLLVCRTVLNWAVLPLRAVGAMPLTAYAGQIVVWAIVASVVLGDPTDLAGFREIEPFAPMTLGIILACTLWALVIGRGPLEWAVDKVARYAAPGRAETRVWPRG